MFPRSNSDLGSSTDAENSLTSDHPSTEARPSSGLCFAVRREPDGYEAVTRPMTSISSANPAKSHTYQDKGKGRDETILDRPRTTFLPKEKLGEGDFMHRVEVGARGVKEALRSLVRSFAQYFSPY